MEILQLPHVTITLAPYAANPEGKGNHRLIAEEPSKTRTPYQRDRDRIIHSIAFRRLEYKTQVFVNHEGDHFRTRLTHSLEVAQIARTLSRTLGLNDDLAEALALGHDLGHPPFGHAGEEGLNERMGSYGGFDHNAQTLKILTTLEHHYASFDGLNLCHDTLEGVVKHNGPLIGKYAVHPDKQPHHSILEYNKKNDLELDSFPSVEAQVAALADDIAYNNHDLDDGLRAGLFTLKDLCAIPLIKQEYETVFKLYPHIPENRVIHELTRRLIDAMTLDMLFETRKRIKGAGIETIHDVRNHRHAIAAFSEDMITYIKTLKSFLVDHMYNHYKVVRMTTKAKRVVRELFDFYMDEPKCLPKDWYDRLENCSVAGRAQHICDYIAGMTDRFAIQEHRKLIDYSGFPRSTI